jgi:hypothetical protein
MQTTIDYARGPEHLSRRERQRLARTHALSRRSAAAPRPAPVIMFGSAEVAVIEQLVRHDRTAVSTAMLAVAGIGAGELRRRAVLAEVGRATDTARSERAISRERAAQIARHVRRALEELDEPIAA